MTPHAVAVELGSDLPARHTWNNEPHREGNTLEELSHPRIEVFVVDPARVQDRPIGVIFEHLLEGPGDGPLLVIEPLVEVDPVFLLQVPTNEGRVRDRLAVVNNVGELALRGFVEAPCVDNVL